MKKSIKPSYETILMIFVVIIVGGILIYRAFHGMDITDETFYLSTAKRLYDGDMLLKHDWNSGQIFGLILLPFYRLYIFFHGNHEGIILFFRILFVILGLYTVIFLLYILRNKNENREAILIICLCVLVYARGNIITISYYSLGFYTFLLSILWWMQAKSCKREKICFLLSGINYAVSVLCMPYMALLCVGILLFAGYCKIKNITVRNEQIVWFLIGTAIAAVIFIIYFFRLIPWSELGEYLPIVLQDPEGETEGWLRQVWDVFLYIVTVFLKYTWPMYLMTFVVTYLTGKKKIQSILVQKWMPCVLVIEFFLQSIYVRSYFEGGIILTFFLFAVQMQLFYSQYRCKEWERFFLFPGFLFVLIWILGSNVGQRVMNMGFLIMDIWAVLFVYHVMSQQNKKRILYLRFPAYLLFLVLFVIRMFDVYRDGAIMQLDCQITTGIMKGIYTEENRAQAYEKTVNIMRQEISPEDHVVVLGCNPWVYLDSEARCGSYTTWQFVEGEDFLEKYYDIFPEKVPDIILKVPDNLSKFEYWRFSSHGVGMNSISDNGLNTILNQIIREKNYICQEIGDMIVYRGF